jgi:hypothetical protein
MAFKFEVKEELTTTAKPPFIEDARADFAPYWAARQTVNQAKQMVIDELRKLNGGSVMFQGVIFEDEYGRRHGFNVFFWYGNTRGIIRVSGLPMRSETEHKIRQVEVQALMNLRDWLKTAVTQKIFSPGSDPLIPFLMLPDSTPENPVTIADRMHQHGDLPMLSAGG